MRARGRRRTCAHTAQLPGPPVQLSLPGHVTLLARPTTIATGYGYDPAVHMP